MIADRLLVHPVRHSRLYQEIVHAIHSCLRIEEGKGRVSKRRQES